MNQAYLFPTKRDALASIKKALVSSEPAGAIYPSGAIRWRFTDGSMAVAHRWGDSVLLSWLFD